MFTFTKLVKFGKRILLKKSLTRVEFMNYQNIIEKIDYFTEKELSALKEFKNEGGKVVATFCPFFPASILAGFGVRSVRILCGANTSSESAGEQLIRSDACSYCKTLLGNFREKTSLHGLVDYVIGTITCDQMRRTLERLQYDLKIPVFPVQLPATITPEAEDYFVDMIKTTVNHFADYTGEQLNLTKVREHEKLRSDAALQLQKLMWEAKLPPIIFHKLVQLFAIVPPGNLLTILNEVIPEIDEFQPAIKIIVIGSVSTDADEMFYNILTERNVGVIPLTCTGLNFVENRVNLRDIIDENLIAVLSQAVFQSPSCIRRRPNTSMYQRIEEALHQSRASGIILKTVTFCDLWYTEKVRIKQSFDVPVLVLDSGYGEGIQNRTIGRVEAFLETCV